jgi:hypothetical protein
VPKKEERQVIAATYYVLSFWLPTEVTEAEKERQWIPEKKRGTELRDEKREGGTVEDEKEPRDLTEDEKGSIELGKRMRNRSVQ